MESVNPEFTPSHSKIEYARTDNVFFPTLPEVSTGAEALVYVQSCNSKIPIVLSYPVNW